MFATSYPPEPAENVSGPALELLDEMRIRLMECRLVLQALSGHADMNFDELENDLDVAEGGVQNAHAAASLVHQGAALDARWGADWSRPRAIFARHGAAVRGGATRVLPERSVGDRIERALWQLPPADRMQNFTGPRPQCQSAVRATGAQCVSRAVYLGTGSFGAHCYTHANRHERDQYRMHLDIVAASQSELYEKLSDQRHRIGQEVSERWLQTRADRRRWAEEVGLQPRSADGGGE
ncbi:hypothetical protein QRB41_26910 [Mycobacterium avium subsp. hominissuis]|nr:MULTISPECIES: hypothetical protein [Mycobacteriaceae]MCA2245774.1 hypothetical protein [Mycobacterium sp. WUMAC-067]MCA2317989.1 hypothetical protein [Mycobacterium sp. WUMAC-025]MDO2386948.1 hypothetical protein [Mycobacterium avium subsp. hominissuis]MDO2397421.1 hypothetical protein [Mycobacterium avium subsp. hominissuis]